MLRHLRESGAIVQGQDGRGRLSGNLVDLGLPQSVREVIGERVERLGADAHTALGAAAVSWRGTWPGPTGRFWSGVCALFAIVLAFALLLQAAAAFMLTGCER